jgi:predicted ATP-grasp superfamily ATP-dependent carboligase
MQRILLYEFATSGGTFRQRTPPSESIRREGLAMITALAADFGAVDGVETLVMLDERRGIRLRGCQKLPVRSADEEFALLAEWSRRVDWVLIVAPEFDDLLRSRCRMVEESGGRLLGPSSSLVALSADKQRTTEHLAAAGVNVPIGVSLAPGESIPDNFSFPAVLKPRFGAGSEGVRRVALASEVGQCCIASRFERFCLGMPASVAFLCGPSNLIALPPCRQRLSDDGQFRYLGGATPLAPDLARRATAITHSAVSSLPEPLGYLGIDLVLGDELDGRNDVVVEVNPRLTTSYVGLRALANCNLAAAMLAVAAGETPRLSFKAEQLEFDADGTVRHLSPLTPHRS